MKEKNSFQGLEVGSYAVVKNHIGLSKVDPKFLGPFEVLGQRDDGNEHIFLGHFNVRLFRASSSCL